MDAKKRKFCGNLTPEQVKEAGLDDLKELWDEMAEEIQTARCEREAMWKELNDMKEERKKWLEVMSEWRAAQEEWLQEKRTLNEKLDRVLEAVTSK